MTQGRQEGGMTTCKHCGRPARPRTSSHGRAPQTCDECPKRVKAANGRRYYLLQLETDPDGFRAYRNLYQRERHAKRTGGVRPELSHQPESVARRLRRWRQAEGAGA